MHSTRRGGRRTHPIIHSQYFLCDDVYGKCNQSRRSATEQAPQVRVEYFSIQLKTCSAKYKCRALWYGCASEFCRIRFVCRAIRTTLLYLNRYLEAYRGHLKSPTGEIYVIWEATFMHDNKKKKNKTWCKKVMYDFKKALSKETLPTQVVLPGRLNTCIRTFTHTQSGALDFPFVPSCWVHRRFIFHSSSQGRMFWKDRFYFASAYRVPRPRVSVAGNATANSLRSNKLCILYCYQMGWGKLKSMFSTQFLGRFTKQRQKVIK